MSQVTVWHDGDCPLCRREIALMRRLDTRGVITFVDAAGSAACPLDRGAMLARFHAREADGPLLSGAAAFAAISYPGGGIWDQGFRTNNDVRQTYSSYYHGSKPHTATAVSSATSPSV